MPHWLRWTLALLFPPLAVADLGTNRLVITSVFFVFMFPFGGPLAAAFFLLRDDSWRQQPHEPTHAQAPYDDADEQERYERAYIELADGEVLEVVDTEEEERRQHTRK